jgi:hypothetical protein
MASQERQSAQPDRPSRITVGLVELITAGAIVLLGAIVIADSRRIGAGWADDGPQAGYFPYYIGLLMTLSGVMIAFHTVRAWVQHRAWFATVQQLRNVYAVLLPTALYIGAIYLIGIYVASALFIGWFMAKYGRFRWPTTVLVSVGVPLAFFMVFDRWFLVPLPKGPLERLLGF